MNINKCHGLLLMEEVVVCGDLNCNIDCKVGHKDACATSKNKLHAPEEDALRGKLLDFLDRKRT